MGYYLNAPGMPVIDKVDYLVNKHNASVLPDGIEEYDWDSLGDQEALVCVVMNPGAGFEAAALVYSRMEMEVFAYDDGRPKTWLIMDRTTAYELAGYG